MLYLDTSLLVSALTREKRSSDAQTWLAEQPAGSLAVSDWVKTEFSAAISAKLRNRQITAAERADVLALFTALGDESFEQLQVSPRDFRAAARFADQYKTGVHAGDALHLAVAANRGARMITLDKGLAKAASALGVSHKLL